MSVTEGGIAQWEAQEHFANVLLTDTVLSSLVTGVFDHEAPDEQAYPYVVFGDWTESNEDLLAVIGSQVTVTIHVWSTYQGGKEVKQIANRIALLLGRKPFATASWWFPVVKLEFTNDMVQVDQFHHMVMRFRLIAEKRS